jgi:hypothetical protein
MFSYNVSVKQVGGSVAATVTRYNAVGGRVITVARGRTADDAVRQARRDVRTARHCGGVK